MTTSIATLNDSIVIPMTKVEFIIAAHEANEDMICDYMDQAELVSIVSNGWDRGASLEDVAREIRNLCDDGWDD
jgi:hypothetical protein